MEEEAAAVVDTLSRNNQPTIDSEVGHPEAEPLVPLRPTSDMRTGVTATPTAETYDTHTSATCARPGLRHNPNATRNNTMGGSSAGLHKTILPSAARCTMPNLHPQAQQKQQQCPPVSYFPMQAMQTPAWQQAAPPVGHGGMPPTGYNSGQRLIMPNHLGTNMMNFIGQYPPATSAMQLGQQPTAGIFYPPPQQPRYF